MEAVGHIETLPGPTADCTTPLFQGWMHKKGYHVKNWRRRFFVLTAQHGLYYYETDTKWKNGTAPLGVIMTREVATLGTMNESGHPTGFGFYVCEHWLF